MADGTLRQHFENTLSPFIEKRRESEKCLNQLSLQPNFSMLLLQFLQNPNENPALRLACAIFFKNYIKNNWDPEKDHSIPINDKTLIKSHILNLMCEMPDQIQKQLSTVVTTIGEYDFPNEWSTLLQEIIQKFNQNWTIINGVSIYTSKFNKFYE